MRRSLRKLRLWFARILLSEEIRALKMEILRARNFPGPYENAIESVLRRLYDLTFQEQVYHEQKVKLALTSGGKR